MKQVMNYHKDNGLLNMIGRTDPMIMLIIISFFFIACNQKNSNNTMYHDTDTSIIVPLAPKDANSIILNRPPTDSDVDSFMTYRTQESFYNLDKRYDMADTMNEFLFYAIVAADKFNISHAYYNIAGCLTNYFSYISIGSHSKEIATYYLKRGAMKNDESCVEIYKSLDRYTEREICKLWIPKKHNNNPTVTYKANSLLGNIDEYNKLKKHLMGGNRPEQLLYYSYIMADRYNYEPARKDVIYVMEKGYEKYGLGRFGKEAKYFCSFMDQRSWGRFFD